MKEIKFRAWNKDEKCYDFFDVDDEDDMKWWYDCQTEGNEMNTRKEMYTGLKDKNGKEIYEGDIIEVVTSETYDRYLKEYEKRVVSFSGGQFIANRINEKVSAVTLGLHLFFNKKDSTIVIGNVYENPELLNSERYKEDNQK